MVCDKGTVPVGKHEQQTPHTTLLQSALGGDGFLLLAVVGWTGCGV
jgi:hypothetical protein